MSFVDEEDILKAEAEDIEKLNAFLNGETSSEDSDSSCDDDNLEAIDTANPQIAVNNTQNVVNIEFNDITPYDKQVETIVSSITTVDLHTALMLNKAQQNLLIEVIKKYQNLLKNCEEELERIQIMKKEICAKKSREKVSNWYRCGVPYFKDVTFRRNCPSNSDTLNKIKNGELALIDLPPCRFWLPHEKEILKKAVMTQSREIRTRMIKNKSIKAQETIEEWSKKPLEECVFPVHDRSVLIDWLKISIHDLNCRHTDEACKAMWYQHLHPHLNTKPYGPREARKLKEIAARYDYQNWDKIAIELGTNRSGYHCCLFYRLNAQKETKKFVKWTPEEDNKLKSLINKFKIGNYIPWGRIAYFLPNRNKPQIYSRYRQSHHVFRKGKFSPQEDLIILSLSKKFDNNFIKVNSYFTERSVQQIRARYNSLIKQKQCKFKTKQWTEEEDKKIIDFVKANHKPNQSISWAQLEKIFDSPHRNRTSIRHRWGTIKNYLDSSFEGDISLIPRLKSRKSEKEINESHLENVLTILNDEDSKICNLSLTSITEEILLQGNKGSLINQFQKCFITNFTKIKIDQPITLLEIDIVNCLFLVNVLHGCLNVHQLFHKRFRNCYTEKNESIIGILLKNIVEKMKLKPTETLFDILRTYYSLPYCIEQNEIGDVIPKCFTSVDQINHMIATIKPFLKYVLWNDSELDTFYIKKSSRFERNVKAQIFMEETLLTTYETALVKSAISTTCQDFLNSDNARDLNASRVTELFKIRFLAVFNFKSMESIVSEMIHKKSEFNFENDYEREKKGTNKLKRGRPRKTLPGGRFKYEIKDVTNESEEDEIASLENAASSSTQFIKVEQPNTSTEVSNSINASKNIKMEVLSDEDDENDDDIIQVPLMKKKKLSVR